MIDKDSIHQQVKEIAIHLNNINPNLKWSYNENTKNHCWGASILLDGFTALDTNPTDLPGIFFDFQHKPGRIIISGFYPFCRHSSPSAKAEPITVSVKRTTEEIAKDITKRFIPQYMNVLAAHRNKAMCDIQRDNIHDNIIDELLNILGPSARKSDKAIYMTSHPITGRIDVIASSQHNSSVHLDLNVPRGVAKMICKILARR